MNILVLAPQWPDPPRQGAAIRNLHILLYLAERHEVSLLTFAPPGDPLDLSRLSALKRAEAFPTPSRGTTQRIQTLATSPLPDMAWRLRSPAMFERLRSLLKEEQFDAVHVEGLEMAHYGLLAARGAEPAATRRAVGHWPLLVNGRAAVPGDAPGVDSGGAHSGARRITLTYDAHNAEYVLQRRAFTTDLPEWRRAHRTTYSLIQWLRLRRFERELCRASDHIIAVSNADRAALGRLAPGTQDRISVLPNGVDVDYWSLDALRGEPLPDMVDCSIVFDGSMDFRPNIDAVRWFGLEVWPMIYAGRKDARFYIVGRNPAPEVAALASRPGIIVTGAVDDTRPWVAGALVYVLPMRMGGGVRLKMLQAMSMERAIVSTPMGAEGVDVENGREMLLAIGPEAFARSVLTLTSDGARRRRLGAAARRLVAERYRWPVILPGLEQIYPGGG